MNFTNIDTIVRRSLLEKNLPIHWYNEYLVHAASCLRELTFDTLKIINTVELPVNSYYAVDLPSDFVDDIGVALSVNGFLRNIPKRDSINPIRKHDSTGAFVANTDPSINSNNSFYGINPQWLWFWNVNDWGEPTGRYFGANGGDNRNGYKVIKERRQIQLAESFVNSSIVLMYISDGQSIDSASQIDTQALSTIQAYINWKSSPNANIERSNEGMTFLNMKRKLRTKLSDLTITDIKNVVRGTFTAAIKN